MTKCAHCKNKQFGTPEEYAQHLIDKHPEDEARVAWAHEVLDVEKASEESKEAPPGEVEVKKEVPMSEPRGIGRYLNYIVVGVAILALIISSVVLSAHEDWNPEIAALGLKNSAQDAAIAGISGNLSLLGGNFTHLNDAWMEYGTDIEELQVADSGFRNEIGDHETRLDDVETQLGGFVTAAQLGNVTSIVNVLSGNVSALSATVSNLTDDVDDLVAAVGNFSPRRVLVTTLTGTYVEVTNYGSGNYPVIVSLYGLNLAGLTSYNLAAYSIAHSWSGNISAGTFNTELTAAVVPTATWTQGSTFRLLFTGTPYYATASVGMRP